MNNYKMIGASYLIERIIDNNPFGKSEGELLKAKVIGANLDYYNEYGKLLENPIHVGDIIYYRSDDEFIVNGQKVVGTNLSRVVFYEHSN